MNNKKEISEKQSYIHLGRLAEITMGQSPDSSGYNTNQIGLPFLQGCAEFGRTSPTAKVHCNPPLRISKPGSILISIRAPVGTQNWGDDSYCIGRGLSAIKARQGIADTKFLSYAISHNVDFLHRRSQGSTFLAIGANELRTIPIPNYDFNTQCKISVILQSVDHAIDKTEALITKYYKIKTGMMSDFFTRGLTSDGSLREDYKSCPDLYQETEIGWIPREWKFMPLSWGLSSSPKNGYSPNEVNEWQGVYVLGLGCLTKNGFKPIQLKNAPSSCLSSASKLKNGDFLISRANTPELVGLCGIYRDVGDVAIYPDLMMKLNLNNNINADFLERYLLSPLSRLRLSAISVGTSSSMVKLNSTSLKSFKIIYPSIDEQCLIVKKLKPIETQITLLESELAKLERLKSGLMHDLLTGKTLVARKNTEALHV
ncbi:restriction endonuclease subunit S [Enterobacter wuhouensis]|uniref:restriction endonuclease subunit S n=1 Tax=Enterobacter wuhouensis TaxID=2529381 RepID=UPI0021E5B0DC|nr:restriction endonuclease subunit S [Enterobacter wuhouensis]MCV2535348.1 restriction endonuclease subunit S [Enterobacter wuhouensis]